MSDVIDKVCNPGMVNIDGRAVNVFLKIKFNDGKLSITGVEGPKRNGDCVGGCGQIRLKPEAFLHLNEDWSKKLIAELAAIWKRWHLNNLTPGTPKQMEVIRKKQAEADASDPLHDEAPHAYASKQGFDSYYSMELAWLAQENLVYDEGYEFGSKWLKEEVPEDVLYFLHRLPESEVKPAWV